MKRSSLSLWLLLIALLGLVAVLEAQFRYSGPRSRVVAGVMPEERTGFTFCRLAYTSVRREAGGQGWSTDYPLADENLMIRLAELTSTDITRFRDGAPQHAIVEAGDDALFQCPFLFASDVGTMGLRDHEVERLRDYFAKGGFLWVDDFWGTRAWREWVLQIGRVLPGYEVVELTPEHPIFSTFYTVEEVPQIPSIQHWRRSGGETSERGDDSRDARMHAIFDDLGRVLVVMTHNTDIADGWEREGEEWEFFHRFSPRGYAVGVNVAIWSMTH